VNGCAAHKIDIEHVFAAETKPTSPAVISTNDTVIAGKLWRMKSIFVTPNIRIIFSWVMRRRALGNVEHDVRTERPP